MTVSYSERETDKENMKIMSLLYIIYILYIIMNLEQSIRGKVWGKMTIVICHNCHFLVEKMSGHPARREKDDKYDK